jgi:hypothetical protein
MGIAVAANDPRWQLSQPEAAALSEATGKLSRHYEFLSQVSSKWVDWGTFTMCVGTIYGSRLLAIRSGPFDGAPRQPAPQPSEVAMTMPNAAVPQPPRPPEAPPATAQQQPAHSQAGDYIVEIPFHDGPVL